jgi:hypothetical protein
MTTTAELEARLDEAMLKIDALTSYLNGVRVIRPRSQPTGPCAHGNDPTKCGDGSTYVYQTEGCRGESCVDQNAAYYALNRDAKDGAAKNGTPVKTPVRKSAPPAKGKAPAKTPAPAAKKAPEKKAPAAKSAPAAKAPPTPKKVAEPKTPKTAPSKSAPTKAAPVKAAAPAKSSPKKTAPVPTKVPPAKATAPAKKTPPAKK